MNCYAYAINPLLEQFALREFTMESCARFNNARMRSVADEERRLCRAIIVQWLDERGFIARRNLVGDSLQNLHNALSIFAGDHPQINN